MRHHDRPPTTPAAQTRREQTDAGSSPKGEGGSLPAGALAIRWDAAVPTRGRASSILAGGPSPGPVDSPLPQRSCTTYRQHFGRQAGVASSGPSTMPAACRSRCIYTYTPPSLPPKTYHAELLPGLGAQRAVQLVSGRACFSQWQVRDHEAREKPPESQ
jgi:hypothetical protein